ncbi:CHAT domain-containing protein [Candidatus Venteria ishoeyi]|uniref:CHAT domain protein n=1 Tax=Candidatus Venteria ishoeyi TaxID=1899563 RepID=A0A1H6F653_9GAMM|nr:tetratricopeptide repeat protein [Candidatus Venteria ishoeyi]SEH04464.1 CHAT domain protein [Candidatus Venteria ishoeyi]
MFALYRNLLICGIFVYTILCHPALAEMSAFEKLSWSALMAQAIYQIKQQDYDKLLPLAEQTYQQAKDKLPPDHASIHVSAKLLWIALTLKTVQANQRGTYTQALAFAKRSYAIAASHLDEKHTIVVTALNNLASLYGTLGDYSKTEEMYLKILAISQSLGHCGKKAKAGSFNPLFAHLNLAALYSNQGHYGGAENQLDKAYVCSQRSDVTPGQRWQVLNRRASLYRYQRHISAAKENYEQALAIMRTVSAPDYQSKNLVEQDEKIWLGKISTNNFVFNAIETLRGLGAAATDEDDNQRTEVYLQRALALSEQKLGATHPYSLQLQIELAALASRQGNFEASQKHLQKLLPQLREAFGEHHPWTLHALHILASAYYHSYDYQAADEYYRQVTTEREKRLGLFHPDSLKSFLEYAQLQMAQGRQQAFLRLLKKIEPALHFHAQDQYFTTRHEKVRQALFNRLALSFQSILFSAVDSRASPALRRYAADVMLRWKAQQERQEALLWQAAQTPAKAKLLTKLQQSYTELALLYQQHGADSKFFIDRAAAAENLELNLRQDDIHYRKYQTQLNNYKQRIAKLSQSLASQQHNGYDFSPLAEQIQAIQNQLGSTAALVAFRAYRPIDFTSGQWAGEKLHWLALLLTKKEMQLVKLKSDTTIRNSFSGLAEAQNCWQEAWQADKETKEAELNHCMKNADRFASKLYQALFAPFAVTLGNIDTLYLIPDGFLHQIPFSRLCPADGDYLIERHTLIQLAAGQDLLNTSNRTHAPQKIIAIGGVNFSEASPLADSMSALENPSHGTFPEQWDSLTHSLEEVTTCMAACA